MSTLEELKARRPVDEKYVKEGVAVLHREADLYLLKQIRKEMGITQKDLAQRIGVSQHRISQIEHGDIKSTSIGTLEKYFTALGVRMTVEVDRGTESTRRIYTSAIGISMNEDYFSESSPSWSSESVSPESAESTVPSSFSVGASS